MMVTIWRLGQNHYVVAERSYQSVNNISNQSPTSRARHSKRPCPTSFTNIDSYLIPLYPECNIRIQIAKFQYQNFIWIFFCRGKSEFKIFTVIYSDLKNHLLFQKSSIASIWPGLNWTTLSKRSAGLAIFQINGKRFECSWYKYSNDTIVQMYPCIHEYNDFASFIHKLCM